MEVQERSMRPMQMKTAYSNASTSGSSKSGGRRAVPSNVNISKPMNQQQALARLGEMMGNRV
jgi:hypothetical protein